MKKPRLSRKMVLALAISCALVGGAGVRAATDSTDSSATVGAAFNDTAITGKVKAKFAADSRLKGSDISVTTNNGVVTLTGSAPSSTSREAADNLASNVAGVRSVNDQIEAPSATSELGSKAKHAAHHTAEAIEDTAITADLKAKLATDSRTKGSDVDVKTSSGIVALSGTVVSEAQKTHLVYVARHTKGVHQVDTTALTVESHQ
jgi:hyperosmotically inducible protein